MEKQTKLLIDGDGLLYRCGFAVEKTHYLVTDAISGAITGTYSSRKEVGEVDEDKSLIWTRKSIEPVQNALFLVNNVMDKLMDRYKMDFEMYLSPSVGNFREKIATINKYKGNRDAQQRPKHYRAIAEYLVETYGAKYSVEQEADDDLGIRSTILGGAVICSLDKDLDQLPGVHYNWVKEEEYAITKKEGTLNFYSQVLSGDPTDNISGLTGIGPVKARKMLGDATGSKDCWQVVLDAYQGEFGDNGKDRAIENARLCWVRRQYGEIWEPPF